MNLTSRLKALAEYHEVKGTHELVELGHVRENARLKPLIASLIECVEALEDISIKIVSPLSMTDVRQLLASIEHRSDEALAKLQALVEEK